MGQVPAPCTHPCAGPLAPAEEIKASPEEQKVLDDEDVLSEHDSLEEENVLAKVFHFDANLANHIIANMWPVVQHMFNDILMKKIEPAVKKKLGSHSKLFNLDRQNCTVGDNPLKLQSQAVHQSVQESSDGDMTNLVVRNDIDWKNTEMTVACKFDRVQVKVVMFHLRCSAILECVGMRSKPPFWDGARGFIINPPHIDLDLEVTPKFLDTVLHVSFVKRCMVDAIVEEMAKMFVVPNRIHLWHAKGTDKFRVFHPRPKGILTVWIQDLHGFTSALGSEPYVIVRCGAIHHKMHVPHGAKGVPQRLDLPIHMPSHQVVTFQVRRHKFTKDDFLGDAHLSVEKMITWGGAEEQVLDLQKNPDRISFLIQDSGKPGSSSIHHKAESQKELGEAGNLSVRAEWRPLRLNLDEAEYHSTGLLFVGVHFISHLPVGEPGSKVCVELSCSQVSPHSHISGKQRTKWKGQEVVSQHLEAEARTLVRKVKVCQKSKMSVPDMVELLEVDKERIDQVLEGLKKKESDVVVLGLSGRHQVNFDQAFEFLLSHADDAVLRLDVRRQVKRSLGKSIAKSMKATAAKLSASVSHFAHSMSMKSSTANESDDSDEENEDKGPVDNSIIGSAEISVKDFLTNHTGALDLNLAETDAILSLRVQLRMLDKATTSRLH